MDIVARFINHFRGARGRFRLRLPDETPYERMVREFEAGEPGALETMRLALEMRHVLPRGSTGSTASEELALWKERAANERAELREWVSVRHAVHVDDGGDRRRTVRWPDGVAEPLVSLYQHIHSAELYVDARNSEEGLRFYPPSAMADELEGVRCWLEEDPGDYEESEAEGDRYFLGMPPWLDETLVFGGVGLSAERFLLAYGGPYRGSVLAFDHDPLGMRIVAGSFESFLARVVDDPLCAARWIGLHEPVAYEHQA